MKKLQVILTNLLEARALKFLITRRYFQFLLVAPAFLVFIIAAASLFWGVSNPAFNFGTVFTWVVWWGLLIVLFILVGRGWCIMCPFGVAGEWFQRLSLWWKRKWGLGFNFKYPRRLRNLWIGIVFFVVFIFLDTGYGISNSPALTAGLITVMILGPVWINLFFERRTFCLYLCPLTVFIGMSSMAAPFEVRRKREIVCRKCKAKACINGSEQAYGCPMMLRHCDFTIDSKGYPLCQATCPAGVDSAGYIQLAAQGRYREGVELHRKTTALVGTLGRVCTHPCEIGCERAKVDGNVTIRDIKRYMADQFLAMGEEKVKPVRAKHSDRVAVVGSGPAGLTCAYDLVKRGYPVTVFEAAPEAGGLLRYGIPGYRLPKNILDGEIKYIKRLGVEIKTGSPVKDIGALFQQGYRAVFVGIGAGVSQKPGIPGEENTGVINALDFLRDVNVNGTIEIGRRVGIIGSGNAAIHSARVARRLGAGEVAVISRQSREDLSALASEIQAAEAEGIKFYYLAAPINILSNGNRVTGIECINVKAGEPEADDQRRLTPVSVSDFAIEVDNVIVAIRQSVDGRGLATELKYTEPGYLSVDMLTMQTDMPGVFAGGDAVRGPADVVHAISDGREAAVSIERYLRGMDLRKGRTSASYDGAGTAMAAEFKARTIMPLLEANVRQTSFREVEKGLDDAAAVLESGRCWNCGYSPFAERVDRNLNCILCTECIKACPNYNLKIGFRKPGLDLWGRTTAKLDESVASLIITSLVTIVSLLLVLYMSPLRSVLKLVLPAGEPPNDWPRVVSVIALYLGGISATLGLGFGFSYLSKLFSGMKNKTVKEFFIHFGYALLPLAGMKFLADILDHVFRTWGAVFDVIRALAQDFPFNRVIPEGITVQQLMSADQTYIMQMLMVTVGFVFSIFAAYKLALRLLPDRETAFRAFLPIGTFIFIMTMAAVWALSAAI
ncbi:MAG: FAD-dependent oxidoreductase [Chloroflexota bacterium]